MRQKNCQSSSNRTVVKLSPSRELKKNRVSADYSRFQDWQSVQVPFLVLFCRRSPGSLSCRIAKSRCVLPDHMPQNTLFSFLLPSFVPSSSHVCLSATIRSLFLFLLFLDRKPDFCRLRLASFPPSFSLTYKMSLDKLVRLDDYQTYLKYREPKGKISPFSIACSLCCLTFRR